MHNYYNMHDTVIMHGCIIVFMLDYLIIQQSGLIKKRPIGNNHKDENSVHGWSSAFREFHYVIFLRLIIGGIMVSSLKNGPL